MAAGRGPLAGRRVVTTRAEPGTLDELLAALGADVVHVPLVETAEPADGGASLTAALAQLDTFDWLVVTSRHGARRVGEAARTSAIRTAAVGTATAAELSARTGRPVDVVPARQTAADLVEVFPDAPGRVLVAQADIAEPTLVDGLRSRGHTVVAVTAYATRSRVPAPDEIAAAVAADAVAFASGSAARAWAAAIGATTPPVVAAIGPTTAAAAARAGLKVTDVAADHSVSGLAAVLAARLSSRP